MKFYSLRTITESLPKKKNSKSSLWVKLVVRKLSFIFTFIFINCGSSAWTASIISVFTAVLGSAFIAVDNMVFRIIGVILIELWLVLDCVDGNIARVKKTSSEMGEFIDALSGYYVTGFVYFAVGFAAYNTTKIFADHAFLMVVLGGISTVAGLLARIIHQKYTYSLMVINQSGESKKALPENEVENKKSLQYLRSRLDKELGISGLFMPFLIVASIFNLYDIFTVFYFLFQAAGLLAVTAYYSLKAR